MSDILERIKAEDTLWKTNDDQAGWADESVGLFIEWYNRNCQQLVANPMYTSHFLRNAKRWKDPEKIKKLWARAMLEGVEDEE